jgi:hypothetical protein
MRRNLYILICCVVLSCSPVRTYQQLPRVVSWEADIRNFEHLDSTEIYSPDAILFAGSSSIRLWSTLAMDMAPFPVIQRGYGGAKLSDFAVYADRIIYPHPCRAIVLFIANDITGNEDDITPEEAARLFKAVVKTVRRKFPDTPVFWIAITPTPRRWNVWTTVVRLNALIRDACKNEKKTYFIETETDFLDAENQPKQEFFMPDSLHLNPAGYEIWTKIIKEELEKVLEK